MSDVSLFRNIFRIPSARWQGWDYGWNGWYFVTICTKDRVCYFGDVIDCKMRLSVVGSITMTCWKGISEQFPFVHLDTFVVMPNHVHGIICIDNGMAGDARYRRDAINRVSTSNGATGPFNPMGQQTLGEIVRWYKGRSTHDIHQMQDISFAWQPRYHDHVIRDEFELNRIRKYIRENPANWQDDELFSRKSFDSTIT